MMLKKLVSSLLCATALTLPGAAMAQEFVLKVSAPVPPTERDVVYDWMLNFERGVEERSGGRIDVQLYPANQLGQLPAAVEGVSMGTIEVTFSIIGFFSSLDPRFQVLDAGGLYTTPEIAAAALASPEVRAMLSTFGEAAGVEPLTVVIDGQGLLISRDPIEQVSDFVGLKVRSGGATPLLNQPLIALGASPVAMPLGEVVPGLQTGTIDAATNSMGIINGFRMADVAHYVTYLPGNYTTVGAVVNRNFMETIGPELAAIVREEARVADGVIATHLAHAGGGEDAFRAAGGTVIRMNDEETAQYLAVTNPIVAGIVATNAQMQADYDVLAAAAAAVSQ